jgi:hypothetical protein
MAKKIIPSNSLDQVGAGNVAKLKLDIGPTYEKVNFEVSSVVGGLDVTDIESIKVVMNGDTRIEFLTLQDLIDINAFYKRSADTVSANRINFMLNFFSSQFEALGDALATGIGTADLSSLVIEIKIAAGAPADIKIEADLFIETDRQPVGVFLAYRNFGVSSVVAGDVQIRDLPISGAVYTALHLRKSDITKVKLLVDQVEVINAKKTSLERFQLDNWKQPRVPISARFTHVDFVHHGNTNNVLNTAKIQNMNLTATFGAAGALNVLAETLERK